MVKDYAMIQGYDRVKDLTKKYIYIYIPHLTHTNAKLSPRIMGIARERSQVEDQPMHVLVEMLQDAGVYSLHLGEAYGDDQEFAKAACVRHPEMQAVAMAMWTTIDDDLQQMAEANARIQATARKHHPRQVVQAPPQRFAEEEYKRTRKYPQKSKKRKVEPPPMDDAEQLAQQRLDKQVQRALALADTMKEHSKRVTQFEKAGLSIEEQRKLLTQLFLHKVKVPETIRGHLRAVERFETWAAGRSQSPWTAEAPMIHTFLIQEGRGGNTVPRQLLSGLEWFDRAMKVWGCLGDEMIQVTAEKSTQQAAKERRKATPYTVQIVVALIALMFQCKMPEEAALALSCGFFITLALACLRFSDLHRSKSIQLSADAIYGTSWRTKNKDVQLPWGALRRFWEGQDWGGKYDELLRQYLPMKLASGVPRNWTWPRMALDGSKVELVEPVQQGSYSNALMVHNWLLDRMQIKEDCTLHSPRFLLPGLAAQQGENMENRRFLGHWGPSSGVPLQYDQAKCCSELLIKDRIWKRMEAGFQPGKDFELPKTMQQEPAAAEVSSRRQQHHAQQRRRLFQGV